MHLIMTHANADFDAIASLCAAYRLYPEAIPVLPNTLNRNVRDFITLHENQLPFVRPKELARQPITRLTLVDTQQLPPLKNLASEALIHIIDHHKPHHSVPPGMTLSLTDTGATITLLVEQLRDLPGRLSSIEASLYLLGIYEDTGSLTYADTTARDLFAAAWLLAEGGARLDLVREYLNYAMTPPQLALYEKLVNSLETHTINGQTIMLGCVDVGHHVPEISSIAHQLRDLYNPAALLIMIEMSDYVQLVARSTTEAVNVGRLAEALGGGGHSRAAAAAIRQGDLSQTKHKLLALLPTVVHPAVSVAQAMSRGVHTFAPNDTVRYAARMMNWYGHEGFPVVDQETNRIVGILSRREVDKARRHQLDGAPISQFMTKGEFFVYPTDGVEAVRQLMVEQRIGQVPVIDPNNRKLIGIVTRTDLINLRQLAEPTTSNGPDLLRQLAQRLSPDLFDLLRQAGNLTAQYGDTLYIVGGFVRDILLLMTSQPEARTSPRFDLDLVVEGEAINLAQRLCDQHGGRVYSHQRFGTAKWILPQPVPFDPEGRASLDSIDFVTARTEFYRHPSALPEVEQSSIRLDLHRRDFTINTLALRLSPATFKGEDETTSLLDFYGGQADLKAGLIRVLHSLSFIEDPTRMLRAARLMARLDFTLEERTAELLHNALDLLPRVTPERVLHELKLIFLERKPVLALQQLALLEILMTIHPALSLDDWLQKRLSLLEKTAISGYRQAVGLTDTPWADITPTLIHYLGLLVCRLSPAEQAEIMERLNLPLGHRKIINQTQTILSQANNIAAAERASELYHLLAPTSQDARIIAWLGLTVELARQQIIRFETELQHIAPEIDGHYLKRTFNLPPGPIYGTILETLRDARLDGLANTLAEEHAIAKTIIIQ